MGAQTNFFDDYQQVDVEQAVSAREDGSSLERRELGRPGRLEREPSEEPPALILVGCTATKADERRPAGQLYTSTLFAKRRAYAEKFARRTKGQGAVWAVLSAHPEAVIDRRTWMEPYDWTLDDHADDPEEWEVHRHSWSVNARIGLQRYLSGDHSGGSWAPDVGQRVEIHAGAAYVDAFRSALDSAHGDRFGGLEITHPVEGLQIGEQLRFYNHLLED